MSLSGHKLQELPGNDRCVDCQDCDCERCGFPDPVWASEELGIVVCDDCMAIHDSLTKATFKSVLCQDWTEESLNKLLDTNNNKSIEFYEKKMPLAYRKPTRCYDKTFREQWIISKYVRQDFIDGGPGRQPKYLFGEKKGYMWKRGRDDRIFQRRWFTLDNTGTGSLKYYADSHATANNLKGEIPLSGLVVSPASEHKIGHPNGLQLMYPETNTKGSSTSIRIIYTYAEAPKDMVEWYQSIRCLKYILTRHLEPSRDDKSILRELNKEIVKEGYLSKTGSTGKGRSLKRWFILDTEKLMYFKRQLDANPISFVRLGSHQEGFSLMHSRADDGWHFHLNTPGRTYHLVAEEDYQRRAWIDALQRVCKNLDRKKKEEDSCKTQVRHQTTPAAFMKLHTNNSNLSTPDKSHSAPNTPVSGKLPVNSSKSLPLPPVPPVPLQRDERGPTIPPRPKDSIPIHKMHQNTGHQQYREARDNLAHQYHRHRVIIQKPSASDNEDIYLNEEDMVGGDDDALDDNDDDGYLKMDQISKCVKSERDNRQDDDDINTGETETVSRTSNINDSEYITFDELKDYKTKLSPQNSSNLAVYSDEDADAQSHVSDYELAEEDPYIEFLGEKAILTRKFTKMGDIAKELSVHLRVSPQCMSMDATLSLSMIWSALASLPGDTGCVILNPIVSCTSFINNLELMKPLSLEIQHCGVLKDINVTKPKLWCMRKNPGQEQKWEEVQSDDQKVSLETKERSFIIRSTDISAFVVKVPKEDIVGKTTRCVTYTSGDFDGNLNARVYFINDNGSDDALQELKRREKTYESKLCDISHKFFLACNNDGIMMTIANLQGLQKLPGSADVMQISTDDLWEKQIIVHNLELTQTAMEGYGTLKVWQENNPRQTEPIELSLKTDTESDYQFIPESPFPPEFINPAFPAHEAPQPPVRRSSKKAYSERRRSSGEKGCKGLNRGNRHQHSAPVGGRASSEEDNVEKLPFSIKHKLFLLLDTPDPRGNDWRMLATKLGLAGRMYEMQAAQNPTLEVLQAFEKMECDICDLEETLRAMKRADAADIVKKFIDVNCKKVAKSKTDADCDKTDDRKTDADCNLVDESKTETSEDLE